MFLNNTGDKFGESAQIQNETREKIIFILLQMYKIVHFEIIKYKIVTKFFSLLWQESTFTEGMY